MNRGVQRLLAGALTLFLLLCPVLPARADAGTPRLTSTRTVAPGLRYVDRISEDGGRVESYALELEADCGVQPIFLQGSGSLYGAANINRAVETARARGYQVLGAINTDFFSMYTGVPLGISLEDGIYKSSPEERNTVTVRDGRFVFVPSAKVTMTLRNQTRPETPIPVTHLNKYRTTTGGLYLYNDYFSGDESLHTSRPGWAVRMRVSEGEELRLTGEVHLTVTELLSNGKEGLPPAPPEELSEESGEEGAAYEEIPQEEVPLSEAPLEEAALPETPEASDVPQREVSRFENGQSIVLRPGEYILTAADESGYGFVFDSLQVGDELVLRARTDSDILTQAEWAGGVGDVLVSSGEISDYYQGWTYARDGRQPRSALGVRKDGSAIFYVVDGRHSEHSRGLSEWNLAQELQRLGCDWAVNLDGGGSSALSVWVPGQAGPAVVNQPSEGTLRACSTYLLLVTTATGGESPDRLVLQRDCPVVLCGTTVDLGTVTALDADQHPLALDCADAVLASEGGLGSVEGRVYRAGAQAGTDRLSLRSEALDLEGTAQVHVVDSLTHLDLSVGDIPAPERLRMSPGEALRFTATGYYWSLPALRDAGQMQWTVEGDVGTMDATGLFTASQSAGASGTLIASAGGMTRRFPVTLDNPHLDVTASHWAYVAVNYCYEKQLVSGVTDTLFGEALNIRRGDFVLMLYRLCGTPETAAAEFPDVAPDAYYASAVSWAKETGLVSGRPDGRFAPDEEVSREECFVILSRLLPQLGIHVPQADPAVLDAFTDRETLSDWAAPHAAVLVEQGIIGGSGGRLLPQGRLSRAQMAAILYMLDHKEPTPEEELPPEELPPEELPPEEQPPEEQPPEELPEQALLEQALLEQASAQDPLPEQTQPFTPDASVKADVSALNVREGPGVNFARVGLLHGGDRLQLLTHGEGDWSRVRCQTEDGETLEGWVLGEYLEPDLVPVV